MTGPAKKRVDKVGDVWIKTDPSLDGKTFAVTVEITEDRAITVTRDGAMRYAMSLLTAVQYAEYDAAVLAQLTGIVDEQAALQTVVDLRKDRPPVDDRATAPLRFEPGVSASRRIGYLTLLVDDLPIGQWDLEPARRHALGLLEAVVAADLDAAYLRQLVGVIGIDQPRARQVIADLINHRPEETP